ncbi:MFS transporter [Paenibacillus tuaregi]|uniref:MFS transporter n=1 Tax=Paenibacillus tuaregi TaxID=1816681 RepID=UPI000A69223C|nr:MFS transporter [Paenibacillus tuaregi]
MKTITQEFRQGTDPKRWWALAVLLLGTFMVILDSFIVNVAIPTIQEQLHANGTQIQFIVAAYVLSYAVLLITGARLGDWLGRKTMFITGMLIFIISSALCGMSSSADFLIFSRVLQGIGAAILIPQVLSIIQVVFPAEEKGKAIGFYGAVSGLGLVAGQIIGGVMLHLNLWGLGWRSVFLINVPIGILAVLAIIPLVRESRSTEKKGIDLVGILILTLTLLLLIYPLVVGSEAGWPLWVFFCFAGSILCFTLFLFYEQRMIRSGKAPLVPVSIFSEHSFRYGVFTILTFQVGNSGFFLVTSLALQEGLHLTAMQSALAFMPIGVAFFLGSLLSPKWAKAGIPVLRWGTLVSLVSYIAIAFIGFSSAADLNWQLFLVPFFFAGLGQGLVGAPLMATIMSGVGSKFAGSASGILSTFMQTANALGVAVIGSLFFSSLSGQGGSTDGGAVNSYIHAYNLAMFCVIALSVVTFILIVRLKASKAKPVKAKAAVN